MYFEKERMKCAPQPHTTEKAARRRAEASVSVARVGGKKKFNHEREKKLGH